MHFHKIRCWFRRHRWEASRIGQVIGWQCARCQAFDRM